MTIRNNEIESGYFGKMPSSNSLIDRGILSKAEPEIDSITSMLRGQQKERADTGFLDKTGDIAKGGLTRIKEAGEGIATGKYDLVEGGIRGAAGALQAFLSPIGGAFGEGIEEGITKNLSDDFKKEVIEGVTPTATKVVKWYKGQSPEQQRHLDNIGVGLEVLVELVGGGTVKKPLEEIATDIIDVGVKGSEKVIESGISGIEKVINTTGKIKQTTSELLGDKPSNIAESIAGIDTQTKNILKEVTTEDFDKYVKAGSDAAENIKNPAPSAIAGDEAVDVLGQITDAKRAAGKSKSDILKAIESTTIPTKGITDDFNVFLKDRFNLEIDPKTLSLITVAGKTANIGDSSIADLQGLSDELLNILTKDTVDLANLDATVDRIQDTINFNKIQRPGGNASSTEKSISSFLEGSINKRLKKAAGDDFVEANADFRRLLDMEIRLTKALGDQGDKGSSLMKTVFSPQTGQKTLRLFKDIEEEFGVDLATKAGLAKFSMQLSGDPRQASLLEALNLGTGFASKLSQKFKDVPGLGLAIQGGEAVLKKGFSPEKVGRGLTKSKEDLLKLATPEEKPFVEKILKQSEVLRPKDGEIIIYNTGDSPYIDTVTEEAIKRGMNQSTTVRIIDRDDLIDIDSDKTALGIFTIK